MSDSPTTETWVNVTEAAEITGYNRSYVVKLAKKMWDQPEDERLIRLRKRTTGYEIWLPDLQRYINEFGYGPHKPNSLNE